MKKVTLDTIAREVGVSKVAVHKALAGKRGVSDELRKTIIETADRMGYEQMPKKRLEHLNLLYAIHKNFFLTSSEQFYTSIYYYLSVECEKVESVLKIVFLDDTLSADAVLRTAIDSSREPVDGIFIAGEVSRDFIESIEDIMIPKVFIDFHSPLLQHTSIHVDNYSLSFQLTQYLIDNGHKDIGFVGDIRQTSAIADRYFGYLKAMNENGLTANPKWHINQNIEHANDLTGILPSSLPTAFVCHCDAAAYKMYVALNMRDLHVATDVSIVSFDNTTLAENVIPALTSAGCSKDLIAKKSFQAMLDVVQDPAKTLSITLKPTFAVRDSVRNLNAPAD
jgi:LacI family transcriptional regulator